MTTSKRVNAVLATIAAATVILMASTCKITTNLDIREMAFPTEQSIELVYRTKTTVYGETVSLPDVLDAESSWQIFAIHNGEASEAITIGTISLENATGFTLDTTTLQQTLAPLASTEFRLKYLPAAPGEISTRLLIPYTIAGRERSFMLVVQGQRNVDTVPIITLLDPDSTALVNNDTPYDFGYSSSTVSKTFTIRNDGQETLNIYSVYSGNSAVFSITNKPATATALAQNATATFTVEMPAEQMATFSSALITVSTNATTNSEFLLNLAGGGATLPLVVTGDVGYRLDGHGYDFGWVGSTGSETQAITIVNDGTIPITIPFGTAPSAISSSNAKYTVNSIASETIAAGISTTVSITANPSADEWAEADLVFTSSNRRTYTLRMMSSSFEQPSDVATPALWLRADKIRSADVEPVGSTTFVNKLPDIDGKHALPIGESYRPSYVLDGIHGLPALEFTGNQHMVVAPIGNIITNATGTTTFVVFRTGSTVDSTRYILFPQYSDGQALPFPRLFWQQWYFNPTTGDYTDTGGRTQWRFGLYGYYNIYRFPVDSKDNPVQANKSYLASLSFDDTITSPNPNIFMWLDGTPTPLGYLYSSSAAWTATPGTASTYNGAFGLPVGDGLGNKTAGLDAYDWGNNPACTPLYYLYNRVPDPAQPQYGVYNKSIGRLNIGASNSPSYFFMGRIAEIVMYGAPLTTAQIETVNSYFTNKYGITP